MPHIFFFPESAPCSALYLRRILGKRPAPEFAAWLEQVGLADHDGNMIGSSELPALMRPVLGLLE